MITLDLKPQVSLGPIILGAKKQEVWNVMKQEFDCEPERIDDDTEYYNKLDIILEYDNDNLIIISVIADPKNKACEVILNDEKIWPRTKKKFYSYFPEDDFFDVFGDLYNPSLDIGVQWDDRPPLFFVAPKGYAIEKIENFMFYNVAKELKKGMDRVSIRNCIRETLKQEPIVLADSHTDSYGRDKYTHTIMLMT